ncbi:hypothetical protein [uncultured Leptotrichia sp.]|jgi:hypothetical efflux family protein|uniref:hypothetical protein n=1 Tax=uncultured Leptotrichia sp. TaxID=159271 RepID=UPI0026061F10|nr:hypothetical protein [uncultured Leptotrichia sp.]
MYLENLREKIFKKDLGIGETFSAAFDLFKIILKENKLLVFFQFILIFIPFANRYYSRFLVNIIAFYEYLIPMFFLLNFVLAFAFTVANNYFIAYFLRKIALKVEGRADKFSAKGILIKLLTLLGIGVGLRIILSVLENLSFIGAFLALLAYITAIVVFVWALLYFYDVYYIRNLTLSESIDYSLKLSEGNRLKKIIPGIILIVGFIIGIMIIDFPIPRILLDRAGTFLIVIVFSVIISLFLLYFMTLQIVIYLNVENNYLKNEGKDSKYNFKDKEEIDLRNSQISNNFLDENNEK